MEKFKAFVVKEIRPGIFESSIEQRKTKDLPGNDVLVRVYFSSLNYKDALSAIGNKGVSPIYPHTPGIDAAGVVEQSHDSRFKPGDKVIVTSYGLGEHTPGGFGQYISVPGDWVVPLPDGLTLQESMVLGSAGFTAAYGMYKLQRNNILPENGEILVTGATGGVGSLAIVLLSKAGYTVIAATGKLGEQDFLKELGAAKVIHRKEVQDDSGTPLLTSRWAGVIDTVGGIMLDTALRQTKHNGTVACCGNILGHELHTSLYPFILRGVSLMGIDSGRCLMTMRKKLWDLLADEWKPDQLEILAREINLKQLKGEIKKILRGDQTGRILINLKEKN